MPVPFSTRTAWNLDQSSLTTEIRLGKAAGRPLLDLTISNPTLCGFHYDSESILAALQNPAGLTYHPDPRGLLPAREAVASYYAAHHASLSPENILLTTSTSEAYSFLFRLLCNAGDQILVAQPSYPLFDFIATLDDVRIQPYPLFYDFGWWIDFAELERRITPGTRAILLVHPNNPTGHATSASERQSIQALCRKHNLALIVDEVFLDYPLAEPIPSFAAGEHPCLTFVVSGLSKIAALPQMKVAWLAAFGPGSVSALARLEVVADTFLSMNAPAQWALPRWLESREAIQGQIIERVQHNLTSLASVPNLAHLPVEAGWSVVLQLPQRLGSAQLAETLVRDQSVITHPASFYALPGLHRVVGSLICPSLTFAEGIQRIARWCEPSRLTL